MTLAKVTPDDLGKDYSSKQLNRMIRKHPKLKLPQTKMDADIAQGVENLGKKTPETKYEYGVEGHHSGDGKGIGTVSGSSSKGIVIGHELTHGIDRMERGKDFMGDRGFLGIGGKTRTQLKSEASASQGILDQVGKEVRRARGATLAHSYDTYASGARINPSGSFLVLKAPTKEINNAWVVAQDMRKGFKEPLEAPEKEWFHKSTATAAIDKAQNRPYKHGITIESMQRRNDITQAARTRSIKNLALKDKKNITNTIKANNEIAAYNKKQLVKNLVSAPDVYDNTINSEVHRYIKETRKTFGPSVARGVIADIRGIRDEVNVIRDKNKAIAYQAKPSTKVKNFFTNVFNKVKGLK